MIKKILFLGCFLVILTTPFLSYADTWRGTAPFCNGKCKAGERQIDSSKTGNGGRCWTGKKVLCTNEEELCVPRQTLVSCWGLVLMCKNGYYDESGPGPQWKTCSQYACGPCFGFGSF